MYFYCTKTFCFLLYILLARAAINKYQYEEHYLDLPLDHFNYLTSETIHLRYLYNNTFAESDDAPILFYTGNEGDIELFAQNTGFIWEAAQDLKAVIVFAEHRYYGKSFPSHYNSSNFPERYGYLNAEQALADYAELLYHLMNKQMVPVIAFGGSYGGMLAAWFRMKYPHIVTGALASSAPIFQFEGLTPCDVFSKIVTSVFNNGHTSSCSTNIKRSWSFFKQFSSNDTGRAYLNKKFEFCKPLTKPDDIEEFLDYLYDAYGNLAMVNYPYECDFLAPLPAHPVRAFCGQLAEDYEGKDLINAMHNAINIYANYTGKSKCLNYSTAYDPSLGTNAWEFQTCTEMVMPMCSGDDNDMFPFKKWDINEYSAKCFEKFKVHPRENAMIVRYGGKDIKSASQIIFSNGLLDPWCGGGVLRSPNDKINIIIIPEGAHHIDLRESNPKDPASVRQARKLELDIIRSWLEEFNPYV